ncbi:hypothetical protein FGADI_6207 [Fusarium gaditjirri]|uniref:Uncharacterized protein n=1 Tax=Fusarium gaditjirri TaxID=282569 RepID=A0A8H4T8S2_9HYPO|nr:hypothetical protein FGADI_6207 [Fusarium gaditjirri]
MLPRLFTFITKLDMSFTAEDVAHRESRHGQAKMVADFEYLQLWGEYPEIAEAFGFNDIFRAVMRRDHQKLKSITTNDHLPLGILERDMFSVEMSLSSISTRQSPGACTGFKWEIKDQYGVTIHSLPDATAAFLWNELQVRSEELGKQGLEISCSLKPFYSKYYPGGFFEHPLSSQICSLAGNFGIKPSDEDGLGPLLRRVTLFGGKSFKTEITYLDWLLKHNLTLEYMTMGFQTSALHDLARRIGTILKSSILHTYGGPCSYQSREVISFATKIYNSEMQSDLPCPCVSGAFNRPLASLLSGFTLQTCLDHLGKVDMISGTRHLVGLIENTITSVDKSYLAGCAVHTLTMELLGIRHIGPCVRTGLNAEMCESDEVEWAELLDEDRHLLGKFDDLDEEFEREFQSRNESVGEFLGGYYTERMLEVLREMEASPTDDYRRELLTAGLILGDPDGGNFGSGSDWVTESEDGYDSEDEIGVQLVSGVSIF